jgi:hypothetical protein
MDDAWGPQLQHKAFFPLPHAVQQQLTQVQYNLAMGVFPEVEMCWVVIDNTLILWNYMKTDGEGARATRRELS